MGFKCGIVGLPNVGKSTIFNALTSAGAEAANYPFCTIEPNVGIVEVPDPRLQTISQFVPAKKIIPAIMEFVDIAGLVRGASKGEGLGNQFLGHIRAVDAILQVVRCFDSTDITHVEGTVDPLRDIETIETELILADVETVQNNLSRVEKMTKTNDKKMLRARDMLTHLLKHLQSIQPARTFKDPTPEDEHQTFIQETKRDLHLLTAKSLLYVCNIDENSLAKPDENKYVQKTLEHAKKVGADCVIICGKVEEELSQLAGDEKMEMMAAMGLKEPGLQELIRKGYNTLGLQTYFTAGEKEIRAWTIQRGDSAPKAAGKIHTDFERGFICAEIYSVEDLEKAKSKNTLRDRGQMRTEGKDYIMREGDVVEFRFNV